MTDTAACPYFDDIHVERVGEFYHTYDFSVPAAHPSAVYAVPKGVVMLPDLDNNIRAFVIKTVDEETSSAGTYKRVHAEDAAQEELLCAIQEPVTHTTDTATELMTPLLAGTRWSIGTIESTALTDIAWLDYQTIWECVLDVAQVFGLNILTRVTVRGGSITGRYIDLLSSRGAHTGKVISYERDTADIVRSGDGGELYTSMIGIGKNVDGAYKTFATSVWTVAGGDPVDKPAGQIWVGIEEARSGVEGYGIPLDNGTFAHRVGVFRDADETVSGVLLTKTYAELLKHVAPQYAYDVSLVSLERMPAQRPDDPQRTWERVRIGDDLVVRDTSGASPYASPVRVVEMRRSYSDPTADAVVLGTAARKFSDYILELGLATRRIR